MALVCRPGPTVGFRIEADGKVFTYLPNHEPGLGVRGPLLKHGWTSGHYLAAGADLLIHDAQYDDIEYPSRVGWGHSTVRRALELATLTDGRRLVTSHYDPSHYDPSHYDARLVQTMADLRSLRPILPVVCGAESHVYDLAALS